MVVVMLTAELCLPPWLLLLLRLLVRLRLRLLWGLLLPLRRRRLPPAAAAGVLIVVHPDLEDLAPDADLVAEVLHQRVVLLLHPPAEALRERQHLLLLLRRELGPEALPPDVAVRLRLRGGPGRRAALLAGRLGRGAAAAAAGRAVVRERRRRVVGVGGVVGVRRRQEQRDARGRGRGRQHRRGRREQELVAAPRVVLAVEAAVAAAGGAGQRGGPVAPGRHELAAAVEHVRAKPRRVVPQALPVPPLGRLHHQPHGREAERRGRRCGRGATATAENAIPRWFLVAPDLGLLRSRGSVPLPLRFPRMELRRLAVSRQEAWWRQRWLRHQR